MSLTNTLLTPQDLLRLYGTILLLMVFYVLYEIYEAVREREPEVIDQHDSGVNRHSQRG